MDMETGDAIEEIAEEAVEEESDFEEGLSLDDMLAQMDLSDDADEEETITEDEETQVFAPERLEEIEIDMDDPEALEMLLGLGERPDWSAKKEEAQSSEMSEDEILAAMGEENPDLGEINSLLNKLDNNELVGDGIEESVLVGFDETDFDSEQDPWLDELLGSSDTRKKKKKEKKSKFSLFGKKKKQQEDAESVSVEEIPAEVSEQETEDVASILDAFAQDNSDIPFDLFAEAGEEEAAELDLISLVEENEKKSKKAEKKSEKKAEKSKGFFAKMMDVLTEEIPEDEEEDIKPKKEKKGKKGKKAPVTDADDNEGILEELDAEEDGGKKGKKSKKEKKAKKEKKKKPPKQMNDADVLDMVQDTKKLPMKMVFRIFALCCSIMALILLVNHFVPKLWSLADARNAFYKQDYETTYQEMAGKELSESDQRLYQKAKMILQLEHKMDAYGNYKEMNMPVEALDSLLSGYLLWQQLGEKIEKYDAVKETDVVKNQIVDALSADYQISEQEAVEINSLDNYNYTLRLEEITGSLSRQNSTFYSEMEKEEEELIGAPVEDESAVEEEVQMPTENVLSEEEVQ